MAITGEVGTLYSDREQTKPFFPSTKTKAVSDENGRGLNALLDDIDSKIEGLTATDVGARPDTWMPTASDVGAAPAGYGLGEYGGKDISGIDLNTVLQNGWYSFATAPINGPTVEDGYSYLFVASRNEENLT